MLEQVAGLRRVVVGWLLALTLLLLAGGMVEDYRSCQRQEPVRKTSAERTKQLQSAFYDDAWRANAFAAIDSDPAGSGVNIAYAARRTALADSLTATPPIDCGSFPPGR